MKYNIACLAYGNDYINLFLNNHLKSILDDTNLPAIAKKHEINYYIFSDRPGIDIIDKHPNTNLLKKTVNVVGFPFVKPVSYKDRYDLLGKMLRHGVKKSLETDSLLTVFAADGVVGKGFFAKLLTHIEAGAGAVFTVPMRCAAEVCQPTLDQAVGALTPQELFNLGYNNLHPLWNASHYEAAQFSKMPYTMLWNSGTGLMARSFSVSPMIFKVTEAMLSVNMADYDLPKMCQNPVWLENWDDAPMIGAEPLSCFYPPFANHVANPEQIAKGFGKHLRSEQFDYVKRKFYYPNKEIAKINETTSDDAVNAILSFHNL